MSDEFAYSQAISDFQNARRKADMQDLLSFLTGRSTELLSYEEVRQKLHAIESGSRELQEIPINSIVGSVGRYTDFNNKFLPRHEFDQDRWSRIMVKATGSIGLPPIDVYRIGEVYFVLDGNHRTSVAKELGATHIQAYVKTVKTRVPITPDLKPDELIIKAEYVDFLEKTDLNKLRPDSDLTLTAPGRYPVLLEHIAVHQYFMGIDQDREIPYNQAVVHWFDNVYLPVVEVIQERHILRYFPTRTETDMYIWIAKHQEELKNSLGWQIDTEIAADDLIAQYAPGLNRTISRVTNRILDAVTPDGLEAGPPTGIWREQNLSHRKHNSIFRSVLVAISKDDHNWQALEQGFVIAQRENAVLRGLHVVPDQEMLESDQTKKIVHEFRRRCDRANIAGDIAVEVGSAARKICERAQWADLVIGKLSHPPADQFLGRLSSGFRIMVRRCSRPILAVPKSMSKFRKVLLAYNGSPKANEALFIGAYMASRWQLDLSVLTVQNTDVEANLVQKTAREYLDQANVQAQFILREKDVVNSVLQTARDHDCDLVIIGGYRASPVIEIVQGSLVDQILRATSSPILICR